MMASVTLSALMTRMISLLLALASVVAVTGDCISVGNGLQWFTQFIAIYYIYN